jgi:hypothetical protein
MPDGNSAMVVNVAGYNAAVQAGGSHSAATPIAARATSGQRTQFIQQIALANDEIDARSGGTGRNR